MARTFRRCRNKRNLRYHPDKKRFSFNFYVFDCLKYIERIYADHTWQRHFLDTDTMKKTTSSKSRQEARRLLNKILFSADLDELPCFVKNKKTVRWDGFSIF